MDLNLHLRNELSNLQVPIAPIAEVPGAIRLMSSGEPRSGHFAFRAPRS